MSHDVETDAATTSMTTAPVYAYLAMRLALDAAFMSALTVPPDVDFVANAANLVRNVSALVAPYCLIISFIILRISISRHPVRAMLAGLDSIVAAAGVAFALIALM